MDGAEGIGNGTLRMFADIFNRSQGGIDIAHIVHRIEHAEHINTVNSGTFNKFLHHVIGVVTVTQNVLPAEQHLLRCIGHGLFQFANTVPRIFTQVADTGIKRCPAPRLQ